MKQLTLSERRLVAYLLSTEETREGVYLSLAYILQISCKDAKELVYKSLFSRLDK